jgi:fluoride ion exporter CrcB/FEX
MTRLHLIGFAGALGTMTRYAVGLWEGRTLGVASGFMGGLTTYSSFNSETTRFLQYRAWASGITNFGVTVASAFVAGLLGYALGQRVAMAAAV